MIYEQMSSGRTSVQVTAGEKLLGYHVFVRLVHFHPYKKKEENRRSADKRYMWVSMATQTQHELIQRQQE